MRTPARCAALQVAKRSRRNYLNGAVHARARFVRHEVRHVGRPVDRRDHRVLRRVGGVRVGLRPVV